MTLCQLRDTHQSWLFLELIASVLIVHLVSHILSSVQSFAKTKLWDRFGRAQEPPLREHEGRRWLDRFLQGSQLQVYGEPWFKLSNGRAFDVEYEYGQRSNVKWCSALNTFSVYV